MDIAELLTFACEQGASDLHISAGEPPLLRVDGAVKKVNMGAISPEQAQAMLYDIMGDAHRKIFEEKSDVDFSIDLGSRARFRVNIFWQRRGMGGVFRQIPSNVMTLDDLMMPPVLAELTQAEKGLVIVTGPTGSGKSTTLAAMIEYINEGQQKHIITIEDPIEFVHRSKKCLINQREVGTHTQSFSNALRAALREDPDIILVGEMRDLETIQLALTAAETGHLVFATLHTANAPKTVDRIIDVFPPSQQSQVRTMLSESLNAVIAQTLCARPRGGRVAAVEILLGTHAVRNLIRESKIHQLHGVMQTAQSVGMQTLDMHLQDLVARGIITPEVARTKATDKKLFG
ncbi:MAG: type IV pilus twitching motility protein PilT [Candidatus Dadabacteria bacterium]|nr:MAG: type IV pilus twitching motility protein PilT [Candidatus Dadabacteria bacterium]